MNKIERLGNAKRWSDVVIHNHVAYWVEVASDPSQDARSQIQQTLAQIDGTLAQIGSSRERLLQIIIYLADLADASILNDVWDEWVPSGHAPVRACVQAGLSGSCRVEVVITASTP